MTFSSFEYECMAMAIRLAARGLWTTDPNPRVGCVIAREGQVLGTGWHEAAGQPHAEINALDAAGEAARGASAFVTLEPCSHTGRTAPCADALIAAGVVEVIVASCDPNPLVNGKGIAQLEAAGLNCRTGLMQSQAQSLNPGFNSRMKRQRPWVRLKIAQSLDGRTALGNGVSNWITGDAARRDVQTWRARSSAILTGIGTVLGDDPSLNVRIDEAHRQPIRVIADSSWQTPAKAKTLGLPGEVIIAGCANRPVAPELADSGATILPIAESSGRLDLLTLMKELAAREVNELHVEAGGVLCGALLDRHLVDEVLLYQAPCVLGSSALPSFMTRDIDKMEDRVRFEWKDRTMVGKDLRIRLQPQYCKD